MALAPLVEEVLGQDLPVNVSAYDGSEAGPEDAPASLAIRSPDALRRILTAPGELGFARAYVAGDIDLDGDIYTILTMNDRVANLRLAPRLVRKILRELGGLRQLRRLDPPPEEARLHGRRHSIARDREAIKHHYDVSNAFYQIVLGPSLTYSCAVFHDPADALETAQANKYELIARKLDIQPGDRVLDVGCGWGGMVMHAAREHGARAVGVTISERQAELAQRRVKEAGLEDQVEIRLQDYREIDDGPFDAISSIGMFEHVGEAMLGEYFTRLHGLVRPGGRLLNHGIARPAERQKRAGLGARTFLNRYVFPDGELHEVGAVVSAIQRVGFEVRHVENLREHYALTLRQWVANLERRWDDAVAEAGEGRARVWRLYMAASAMMFSDGRTQLQQVLGTKPTAEGSSEMPLRPVFG